MKNSKIDIDHIKNSEIKYKLVVPDGGWGYVIMLCIVIIFGVVIVPMGGFGIVYNQFLEDIGDVAGGAAIANGIFNTALCFTGLAANQLLQKLSFRKVGLIGVAFYCVGSFSIIFVQSLFQLVVSFGILQGIGFGLLMPTIFSTFNTYFEIRKDVVMSISQTFLGVLGIFVPAVFQYLMDNYGFRGTVALLSAMGLHTLIGVVCIQPVKWHMKKRKLSYMEAKNEQEKILGEGKPLLKPDEGNFQPQLKELNNSQNLSIDTESLAKSLQNVDNHEKPNSFWKTLVKALDLGLFKDPVYINMICGIALSVTSDLAFLPLFPTILFGYGFNASEVTMLMTTYFTADLVGRTSLFALYSLTAVRNRYVFLTSALFSGIFRIVFTMNTSFWWIACISAILGFIRSPILSILPLVVAEAYGERFVTAFSLYMVVCGFVALGVGFLAAAIKDYTQNNLMVMHLYSVIHLLCGIPWTIEILYFKLFKKKEVQIKE